MIARYSRTNTSGDSTRRVISPVTEANTGVYEFFTAFVQPVYQFREELHYVCHTPYFPDLVRAMKHHVALSSLC